MYIKVKIVDILFHIFSSQNFQVMFFNPLFFSFLFTSPLLVYSLQCYDCNQQITLNYTLTSETIPPISSKCQLKNSTQCAIWIEWNLDNNSIQIGVHGSRSVSTRDDLQDRVVASVLMNMKSDNETLSLSRNVGYYCSATDQCNNENNLQRILRALTIEDQFQQELSPLLKAVSPFDAKQAACFDYKNVTDQPCPPTDLDACQRCEITSQQSVSSDQQICATCSSNSFPMNILGHGKVFFLNNRTQYTDYTLLDCQVNGCNSIENNNRIRQASKITFNLDQFLQN